MKMMLRTSSGCGAPAPCCCAVAQPVLRRRRAAAVTAGRNRRMISHVAVGMDGSDFRHERYSSRDSNSNAPLNGRGRVEVREAVILARGLGTRMRRPDAAAALDREQSRVADAGLKAMIPIGRPFLDYVLSALADAGVSDVCLVIGPEHDSVRTYYTEAVAPRRLRIRFAVQER